MAAGTSPNASSTFLWPPNSRIQSSHPIALLFLYLFRTTAIAVYIFCGFFTDNYVLSVRDDIQSLNPPLLTLSPSRLWQSLYYLRWISGLVEYVAPPVHSFHISPSNIESSRMSLEEHSLACGSGTKWMRTARVFGSSNLETYVPFPMSVWQIVKGALLSSLRVRPTQSIQSMTCLSLAFRT